MVSRGISQSENYEACVSMMVKIGISPNDTYLVLRCRKVSSLTCVNGRGAIQLPKTKKREMKEKCAELNVGKGENAEKSKVRKL